MSTTAASPVPLTPPPLWRLTLAELRKMSDTRAGFWLRIVFGLLMVALVVITCTAGGESDRALDNVLSAAVAPAVFLLPVIGILLVTSEWTQRTTLITFTIVPQRLRIVAAKLLAGLLATLVSLVVGLVLAMIATAVSGGEWSLSASLVGQVWVNLALVTIMGIAFGAVIQNSAPAIVLYFVLPTALGVLGALNALEDVMPWLNAGAALGPMTEHLLSGTEWGRVATSAVLWVALPLTVGAWRISRQDIQ